MDENLDELFTSADVVGNEAVLTSVGVFGFQDENEEGFIGGILRHTHRGIRQRWNGEFRFVLVDALHGDRYRGPVELAPRSVHIPHLNSNKFPSAINDPWPNDSQ